MEETLAIINLASLLCEIRGAYLLFKHSFPPFLATLPGAWMTNGVTPEMLKKREDYIKYSRLGFLWITIGFILQFVPSLIKLITLFLNHNSI